MLTELDKIVKDNIVEYKDENEFLKYSGLDKEDFNQWAIRGISDDGFIEIFDCYYLAGDATNGNYMKITDVSQITDLLLCEIRDSDFNEIVQILNEDNPYPDTQIDPNNTASVLQLFFDFAQEVATFPIKHGKYKGGLMLVINED